MLDRLADQVSFDVNADSASTGNSNNRLFIYHVPGFTVYRR